MFRLLALLCGTIFLTMLIGGREGGAVRYGLVPGKIASLIYDAPDQPPVQTIAVAAVDRVPVVPTVRPKANRATGVINAAFVEPSADATPEAQTDGQAGLTLSLPLVRPGDPPEVANVPAPAPDAEPLIQYVQGSSVNVRAGPSADTEALTRLGRGEAVLVLPSDTPGWSMIRIEGDGVEGYIASRFLGDRVQDGLFSSVD